MNEDQNQSVANTTETQTKTAAGDTKIMDKAEQQNLANSENVVNQEQNQNVPGQNVKENQSTDTPQENLADPPKVETSESNQKSNTAVADTNDQVKPAVHPSDANNQHSVPAVSAPADNTTQDSDNSKQTFGVDNQGQNDPEKTSAQNTTKEPPKKLSDVVPSSLVWISGMVGKKQIDCAGPFEAPFKIDKPTWPYVNVAPNPNYTSQVFDYDADGGAGRWVPTDAKSQGQMLTDLVKQVTTLQDDSQKHDQTADQSQKVGMQLTQMLMKVNTKVDELNTKLDGILNNSKDGDK